MSDGASAVPPPALGLASLPGLVSDPPTFLTLAAQAHGDVVDLRFGPLRLHLMADPASARHVLQEGAANFHRPWFVRREPGLLGIDGEGWRRRRRLVQQAFHPMRAERLLPGLAATVQGALGGWRHLAADGAPIDAGAAMREVAWRLLLRAIFGEEADGPALRDLTAAIARRVRLSHIDRHPLSLLLAGSLPGHGRRGGVEDALEAVVARRRTLDVDTGDLLSAMLAARDRAAGDGLTNREVRDEVMALLTAGHETTANVLTWTWYLLSRHPAVAERVRAESVEALDGAPPTAASLARLEYTGMVLDEVMRLYPPIWLLARTPLEDDVVCGHAVRRASLVLASPFVIHRRPRLWENPEGFDPERFAPGRPDGRPAFGYLPFGGGPRVCVGRSLALLELRLVVAMVARTYELDLVPGHRAEPRGAVTLRPRGPVPMTLRPARW
jgi:cytochrome P450